MSVPPSSGDRPVRLASKHLVSVWNPSYDRDALDRHVEVLLGHARDLTEGRGAGEETVYVWWGRVRSPHRQAPLPHLDEVLALDAELRTDDPPEMHLYLTDYRSLFVAHVGEITRENGGADPAEERHVPAYYRREGLMCDFWFRLWDIRTVILDDTPAVIAELRKLRNVHYNLQPVSLYGGMVNLPLIVEEEEGAPCFDDAVRESLADGMHWVEFDAAHSAQNQIQRDLRDNRFGPELWAELDPFARLFVATAETMWREHARDPNFDLSSVVVALGKAMEVQVKAVFRSVLRGAPAAVSCVVHDGQTIDLARGNARLTLGGMAHALQGKPALAQWLRERSRNGVWFAGTLPAILKDLVDARNEAAHGTPVALEKISRLRRRLVGVGCKGDLVELAEARRLRP